MACMRLGSKSDSLQLDGQTWICSTGLASDVTVEIGEMTFQLHKFPLISRSGLLEKQIEECTFEDGSNSVVKLDDVPGGAKAFELVTKFCYGMKLELTALNVVSLRCAAEYLQMTEEYGEGNLISQTEAFLNEVFSSWNDSMKALETCEEVLPQAEEVHVVSRCINSLAMKATADPSLFSWPVSGANEAQSPKDAVLWNDISAATKSQPVTDDWWFEDVSFLSWPLFKKLIKEVENRGMKPERVAGCLVFYARRYLPSMHRQSSFKETNAAATISIPSETDQRTLLEEIVGMLPLQKGVTQTKFLLRLLRSAMVLHASSSCRENLEKRIGVQLEQASLIDLLIPSIGYSTETLYDIDCVQRIVDHFMMIRQVGASGASTPSIVEEEKVIDGSQSLAVMTMVADLVDSYLAEVAPDVNLKLPKFQALAAAIPDYARTRYDGIYHAIDIYLKAHHWLTETEREQICRLMNCQKLSLEASTHAAQNERLPLRVVVQVLFFEQLRLRTQISGWFFVSDNLEGSQNRMQDVSQEDHQQTLVIVDNVRERVSGLEKECCTMRQELQRLAKTKRRWSILTKMFPRKKVLPRSFGDLKHAAAAAN
ncbi:BTB/POZ domain-containing protein [Drosera capensis]